jgi:hypothetical protein
MPTGDFANRLNQTLDFTAAATDPYGQTLSEIKGVAKAIEAKLNDGLAGDPIRIEIEPGFRGSLGQQLNIVLRIPAKQYRDTLFRAYVPDQGAPIHLDLYGERPEPCQTLQELEDKVLAFLNRLRDRMTTYRDYATS